MEIDRLLASLRRAGNGWRPSRRDALMASLGGAVPLVPVMAQGGRVLGTRGDTVDGPQSGPFVARPDAPARTLQAKALDIYSVNDKGAKGDGKVDDTAAINAAILEVHTAGGGEIIFGSSPHPYYVRGPIIVPSNVAINLNGQTLTGDGFNSGTMFTTGVVRGGRLVPNKGTSNEKNHISYAAIRNGMIRKCAIAFDLQNFNISCTINDISTFEALQFGIFRQCFYMSMRNCSARGPSDPTRPAFHFTGSNNLISLHRVSATMASGFLFEGGSTSINMLSCSCEGGAGSAVTFRDDCLGIVIDSGYWEAISGIVFDFRWAKVCSVELRGNYINYTDTVIDDGGVQSNATLFGSFDSSNYIANIGVPYAGKIYRGRMLLNCPRNFIRYDIFFENDAPSTLPQNWSIGPTIQVERETAYTGLSLSDVRSRSRQYHGAPIPLVREGNVGSPLPGAVDRSRIALHKGPGATATIDSAIVWSPHALRATFVLTLVDDSGENKLFGEIYGDQLIQLDRSGKAIALEQHAGVVRLRIVEIDNRSGNASITGSLQICT